MTQYDESMSSGKVRVTVTVDPELVEAANRAVAEGGASSLSAWVNAALADRAQRDEKLAALRRAVEDYEAEFGVIAAEEIGEQERADARNAVVVDGRSRRARGKRAG